MSSSPCAGAVICRESADEGREAGGQEPRGWQNGEVSFRIREKEGQKFYDCVTFSRESMSGWIRPALETAKTHMVTGRGAFAGTLHNTFPFHLQSI